MEQENMIPKDPLQHPTLSTPIEERIESSEMTKNFLANGGTITYAEPEIIFIRINPSIENDGVFKPVLDIYWNKETKQVDTLYEGPVSDAAKLLMDTFAEQLFQYFKEQLRQAIPAHVGD